MSLTAGQLAAIKADITANADLNSKPNNSDGNDAIAKLYNLPASPVYNVWSTAVARAEIYNKTSPDGTSWDWTFYKNQSVTEQNAWTQMFMGDAANFGQVNLRVGIGKIFTSAAAVNRDHALSMGRRTCTRLEKLLAVAVVSPPANTGNNSANPRGSSTNPDVLAFEGAIDYLAIEQARNLP